MKTKRILLLSNNYSTLPDQAAFDSSLRNKVNYRENKVKRNRAKGNEVEKQGNRSAVHILEGLYKLSDQFAEMPSLLTGPLRHLKVEPHYREPTCRLLRSPQAYRKTSKIRLTGNWIEKAGFNTHERIRVIPIHRMLIIVPEIQI